MTLELIIGPMFSGKTTTLIARVEKYTNSVIIRSSIDTRTNHLQTHGNIFYKGHVIVLADLKTITNLEKYDVIGIDEGHFFNGYELFKLINDFVRKGKIIFIAMLKSNYKREPFPLSELLFARATDITVCKSICEICHDHSATNTKRRDDPTKNGFVGGIELYYPCCDKCWTD